MKNSRFHGYQFLLVALTLAFGLLANAQTYTDLHDFNETNGCCAIAPSLMAQGRDGNIYGATTSGGIHFYGNIFKITPTGTLTSIHDFDLTHGGYPQGGLSMGLDGNFYGTTYQGGKGYGIVFQITPSGTFTELYDFTNTTDGAYPKTPPVQAQDGNLYGTTNNGTISRPLQDNDRRRFYAAGHAGGAELFTTHTRHQRESLRHHPVRRDL